MASSPYPPVLIPMASSMFQTKIFPSPIRPVSTARWIASNSFFDLVVAKHNLDFHLGEKTPTYSAPQ